MPGQATVTVNENQWNVWVASTYTELTTGLSGRESIPAGTGMLFILPAKQQVTVDTSKMNFPLDIIFISEGTIIDVAGNIQPGYVVTEETPCDMFLEVNAGEAAGIEVGDTVSTVTIQQPGLDFSQIISFAIPVAVLGFVCAMAGGMVTGIVGSPSPPKRLTGGYHSMWLNPEQRKGLEEKYGMVAVRWAEEATKPDDLKAAEAAAEYYYKKLKEVFGLGHLSPELSEEQLRKLREVLGLTASATEVLKIHQETGYIP